MLMPYVYLICSWHSPRCDRYLHRTIRHSRIEYVRDDVSTNGIESVWALLKRAYMGTFHSMSRKYLNRYLREFTGRCNNKDAATIDQMGDIVQGLIGKSLPYATLKA